MTPDKAAEMLQIPERGMDLLKRCDEDEKVAKAITQIQAGFAPRDVAKLYGLDYDESEVVPEFTGRGIGVWQCSTERCKQKERVSTASEQPRCPGCRQLMPFLMEVTHTEEVNHMRRTFVPDPGIADPLARTDKSNAPHFSRGDDD